MLVTHRYDSDERQHHLLENHYSFKLKPRLLYVGSLDKHGGWTEEPHSHGFLEIIFITDGKGKITVDNKNYQVKKGDLLIYNSGVTHCEKSNETDPMEILFIAYDKLEITNLPPNSLLPESYGPIFHTEEMYDVFHRYFTALITEFELKERFYMEICQNISRTLIMYIFRLINRTENASALLDKSMTMETVLAYIDENFKRKLTLDEVAEKMLHEQILSLAPFHAVSGREHRQIYSRQKNRRIEKDARFLGFSRCDHRRKPRFRRSELLQPYLQKKRRHNPSSIQKNRVFGQISRSISRLSANLQRNRKPRKNARGFIFS